MAFNCIEKESLTPTGDEYIRNDLLICSTNGYIYAIYKKDGTIIWSTYIAITASVISLFVSDNDRIIAGAAGNTYSIDLMTGEIKWTNSMSGFGYSEVSIVTTSSTTHQEKSISIKSKYEKKEIKENERQVVIACSKGKAITMDFDSGETIWTYDCPYGGYNIPVAIIETVDQESERPAQLVYIGSGRCVYCLSVQTGYVIWSVSLSWNILGPQYMTLASPWSSKLAAETNTAFSQNPSAQAIQKKAEENKKKRRKTVQ